ncbi:PREDICTED: serine/threonine-protein kinase TBK1-like [Branchiostoma belcheri]|uniref:Serine/threonine-protein kinase TBK1-like n=1 Tax=Branchiostoma belcheri TaxID=7741 RepID=A0A6P4ZYX0_BRABE|nr:PREDICTED: serine/threonine-protein kinase TBK1-like [Branchiostoma belcheri]XP_019634791.1 PREDICTED: serine/threonine-protein kinase TBK1-like [Branchiostoma belcheri]XP_019634792.1 PREDICTED: serine/threonine-protein kinase TBK1-like [Branchiostoma belcheri]
MGGQLRSSQHFVWRLCEPLGVGATSTVYKGVEKASGRPCAVKCFNSLSYSRPREIQQREFEVLKKLKHRNIVQLLAIEEESSSRVRVIVTEYCGGGSLYTLLSQPENSRGLPEPDFLTFLFDISDAMKYLRANGFVHRDLKPGNILKTVDEAGRTVFKLTDFGAARSLQDDEMFRTICGTEEFLHPEIYARALLQKNKGQSFRATADLWSIGVTIYQVATGSLPFQPYGGPRRDRETMFKIATRKGKGVISGVQIEKNGHIIWSKELPNTCELSGSLKALLTPILVRLLESDQSREWTYDGYFSAVEEIQTSRVVDVFMFRTGRVEKLYMHGESTLAEFQEEVASKTDVRASEQQYFLKGRPFCPDPLQTLSSWTQTDDREPLILVTSMDDDSRSCVVPSVGNIPEFPYKPSLQEDAETAKEIMFVVHKVRRASCQLRDIATLRWAAVECVVHLLRADFESLMNHVTGLHITKSALDTASQTVHQLQEVCSSSPPDGRGNGNEMSEKSPSGHLGASSGDNTSTQLAELEKEFADMTDIMMLLEGRLEGDEAFRLPLPSTDTLADMDTTSSRIHHIEEEISKIHQEFQRQRKEARLAYHDEKIHSLARERIRVEGEKARSVYLKECSSIFQQVWTKTSTIMKRCVEYQTEIKETLRLIDVWISQTASCLKELNKQADDCASLRKSSDRSNTSTRSVTEEEKEKQTRRQLEDKKALQQRMHELARSQKEIELEAEVSKSLLESLTVIIDSDDTQLSSTPKLEDTREQSDIAYPPSWTSSASSGSKGSIDTDTS